MTKFRWTANDIPNLAGRVAIVTGANTGIGYEIARELTAHGADVIVTSRDREQGLQAVQQMGAAPSQVEAQVLDLANLASVRRFADKFLGGHAALDILVNNAGVAGGPRRITLDGYEIHFQVNYLGHFALTWLLLPALHSQPGARVVTVSSDIAARGRMNFNDLQGETKY